jgi:hypothetical protein
MSTPSEASAVASKRDRPSIPATVRYLPTSQTGSTYVVTATPARR